LWGITSGWSRGPESPQRVGQHGRREAVQHGVALRRPVAVERPNPGDARHLAEPVELGPILGGVTTLDPLPLLEVPVQSRIASRRRGRANSSRTTAANRGNVRSCRALSTPKVRCGSWSTCRLVAAVK